MFTGLITAIGTIRDLIPIGGGQDARFTIEVPQNEAWPEGGIRLGASIACSGCCLTVVQHGPGWFAVEASAETLGLTTLGQWRPGSKINLEGSLRLGDELGGHLVSGHVDGLAAVVSVTPEHGSQRWRFSLPAELRRFVAPKGSIAVNGISLTVNEVAGAEFGVNIIAHTSAHTNLGTLQPGDQVNIEIDMLARYVARAIACD